LLTRIGNEPSVSAVPPPTRSPAKTNRNKNWDIKTQTKIPWKTIVCQVKYTTHSFFKKARGDIKKFCYTTAANGITKGSSFEKATELKIQ